MDNNEFVMTYTDNLIAGLIEFFVWSKWFLALGLCLTIADLAFGISAAKYRRELIKRSRAVRRTIDKVCSYVLWIVLAYMFGHAFGQPFGINLLPVVMLLVIYGVELESVYVNYFAAKGRSISIDVLKFFSKKADIMEIKKMDKKDD